MRFNEGIDIKIVYCDDTPSEYIDDVTMNDIYDILDSSSDICKIVDVSGNKKKVVWTDEYGFERAYESKKCIKKSMKEGIQKKDWENWKIDSIGGTVFEYYFNGHNEKENVIQSLIEDDYPTIKVDYGEILGALNKEFRGKTLGDMQKKGYILPWGKDVDLGIHFDYEIEKLNSLSNGNSGMVELHCDFYIPSTDEIYNFGCHAFVYVDDLDVSMFLESKKSAKKSLKEGIDETLIGESKDGQFSLYFSDQRRANHGKDPHYEIILATNGYFTKYIRTDDKKAERVVSDWITLYDIDLKGVKFSELFESKKSAKKSLKESTEITEPRMAWISLLNHVCNFSNTIHSDSLWKALKKNPREEITLDEFVDECEKFVDMTKIRGMIEDYLGNDKQIEDNLKMYGLWNFSDKFAESKKSMKKSLKESKDSDFFNGIAKEYHFSKDEKTRYKDKTHISAIGVLFDRINDAIKIYGRNSDEEYNALNDCWSVITSAKQNGWNVDYEEDKWNKIAGLPNYH